MDFGSALSDILGGNNNSASAKKGKNVVYTSPTTNSYSKSIEALRGKLDDKIIELAHKIADPHDKNSFEGSEELCKIYEQHGEDKIEVGTKRVFCRGKYEFRFFAHLKTVEVWVQTVMNNT